MRIRDLITITYRSLSIVTDTHGGKTKSFSTDASTIIGSVRPETVLTDVKGAGSVLTGNILIYVPKTHNATFTVKEGDGFYLEGDNINDPPTWIVTNRPFPFIRHYILVLKNKVE